MFLRLTLISSLFLLSACWGEKEEEKIEAAPGQDAAAEVANDTNDDQGSNEAGAVSEASLTEQAPEEVSEVQEKPQQLPEPAKTQVPVQAPQEAPVQKLPEPKPDPVAPSHSAETTTEGNFQYLVVKGDSLSEIAGRVYGHMGQWRLIHHSNPSIRNPNLIYPGDMLNIPVTEEKSKAFASGYVEMEEKQIELVHVQKGETLAKIAEEKLGTSENWRVIWAMNRQAIHNPNALSAGVTLKVCPAMIHYHYTRHHHTVGSLGTHKHGPVQVAKTGRHHVKMIGGVSFDLIHSIMSSNHRGRRCQ